MTIRARLDTSPGWVRVAPFVVFLGLTFGQGQFGSSSKYWFYLVKTLAGAGMLWALRPWIPEMRWRLSWPAVMVGVGVFAIWVGLDGFYPSLDEILRRVGGKSGPANAVAPLWNPQAEYGAGSVYAWFFIGVRLVGSSLVVPPLEEVFYRSFLYRYLIRPDFLGIPLGYFGWVPFLVTAGIFGFQHNEWLAGVLCGFAYQGLVCWKKRLGDAMTAHAITNLLLGLWVVGRGAWHFW
jgi:uncharacterized protein